MRCSGSSLAAAGLGGVGQRFALMMSSQPQPFDADFFGAGCSPRRAGSRARIHHEGSWLCAAAGGRGRTNELLCCSVLWAVKRPEQGHPCTEQRAEGGEASSCMQSFTELTAQPLH